MVSLLKESASGAAEVRGHSYTQQCEDSASRARPQLTHPPTQRHAYPRAKPESLLACFKPC
eukprot:1708433-Rhodomonas_salina.1